MLCPCGNGINRQGHDTDKDWAWKTANQRCRRKCLRLFPAAKSRPLPSLPSAVKWVEGESRAVPKVTEWRSDAYLAFIRQLPSVVSGAEGCVAHHVGLKGRKGVACKVGDDRAVALTPLEHATLHHKGENVFWREHGIDIEAVILQLCEEWQRQQSFKSK